MLEQLQPLAIGREHGDAVMAAICDIEPIPGHVDGDGAAEAPRHAGRYRRDDLQLNEGAVCLDLQEAQRRGEFTDQERDRANWMGGEVTGSTSAGAS